MAIGQFGWGLDEFETRDLHNASMRENADPPELTGMLKVLRDAQGSAPRPYYQSFLLRMWRERPDGAWRASLENVTSGEKHGFAHLEQLVAFLEKGEVASNETQSATQIDNL